ncbi:hypothetical protein [Streptomyces sp. NBC_01185]|uniref:hypothetical protein n=1 Tax=Streptomyces sp. NBC_01185 TaxID=2903764 RepID=UPI00386835D7|nr:hypothetical protein OG770_13275 [Streptomyces sp. NBC_01185]
MATVYTFLTVHRPAPRTMASALASALGAEAQHVDVADEDTGRTDDRNRDAPVLCTRHPVAGDLALAWDVSASDAVTSPPSEAEAASRLAVLLRTTVLYPASGVRPSAYWAAGPDGRVARARLLEGEEVPPVLVVDAVETPMDQLPTARVEVLAELSGEEREDGEHEEHGEHGESPPKALPPRPAALASAVDGDAADRDGASWEDGHDRWELYRRAADRPPAHELLLDAVRAETDEPLASAVVVLMLERLPISEHGRWTAALRPDVRGFAERRSGEMAVLASLDRDAAAHDAESVRTWSDRLQLRVARGGATRSRRLLDLLAEHGRTKRIRRIAAASAADLRAGRDG